MEHESFENEAIAKLMNDNFINIKVDREERPDLDQVYMSAVQAMTGSGGWPMTVFLLPTGEPFYGGTYFPPDDRYGRPGFPKLLLTIAEAWRIRRKEVQDNAQSLRQHLGQKIPSGRSGALNAEILDQAARTLAGRFDSREGGFGGAPKFPAAMTIDFLLRYHHRSRDEHALQMATFTLDKMAYGGMYDQVGGGFHRYSTDDRWLVPHFEKMLYDNALLARTYLDAWRSTGKLFTDESPSRSSTLSCARCGTRMAVSIPRRMLTARVLKESSTSGNVTSSRKSLEKIRNFLNAISM
jgi:uncharacterized protein YyaL (SSP411 family)